MPVAGSGSDTVNIQSWFERVGISFGMKRDGSSTSPSAASRCRECVEPFGEQRMVDEVFEQTAVFLVGQELVERGRFGALVGERLNAEPVFGKLLRQE